MLLPLLVPLLVLVLLLLLLLLSEAGLAFECGTSSGVGSLL